MSKTTQEWMTFENLCSDTEGREAVAEVVRLRRALEQLRDMYDALATGDCAVANQHRNSRDALTRILNGDTHE